MPTLIDGYNLMHTTGAPLGKSPDGALEAARMALLDMLSRVLPRDELPQTTVVFDAAGAPPGLPRETDFAGMRVLYSTGYRDADEHIEELIRADHTPRRLTVVSSDHRIQRAAKRRRARAVDSDVWLDEALAVHRQAAPASEPTWEPKHAAPLSRENVNWWLHEFGPLDVEELAPGESKPSAPEQQAPESSPPVKPGYEDLADLANPFPPGYGEDLLE